MKKVIALSIASCFAFSAYAEQQIVATGKTFNNITPIFQSGSPERVSLFASIPESRAGHRANFNGDVQVVVLGGRNTNRSEAAQYYLPATANGVITFNSSVDAANSGTDTLQTYWSGAQEGTFGAGTITPANFSGTGVGAIGYNTATGAGAQAGTAITIAPDFTAAPPANSFGIGTTNTITTGAITTGQVVRNNTTANAITNASALQTATPGTFAPFDLSTVAAFADADTVAGDFNLDTNRNTSIVRPWNFGIGYAPNVQVGATVAESAFVSTIAPELERSFWGIGATWKQILSDKDTGFWLELSTALQGVKMNMNLNEEVLTELDANPYTSPTASQTTWADSWGTNNGYATSDVTTITQAFAQDAWLYGKIDGAQSVTRLADIELKVGYQFICEDNVLTNGFLGLVIPTGNKATAEYMAEPIVGNGFHFGLMAGGTYEIQLNSSERVRWSMRADSCYRYLFKNTQVRSIDTNNGNWSRYMYVWENYAAEQLSETVADAATMRAYTPGINVFTQEVNVTPQGQIRFNQALVLEAGAFKIEGGWNTFIRQDELVTLVNEWQDNTIVYADASNNLYSLYNANRTIYNDAYQSSPVAATTPDAASLARYEAAAVQASDLNIDGSAASWSLMTNTPYLVVGYGFGEDHSSILSVGGSFEYSASNDYLNSWMLFGKFSFTF